MGKHTFRWGRVARRSVDGQVRAGAGRAIYRVWSFRPLSSSSGLHYTEIGAVCRVYGYRSAFVAVALGGGKVSRRKQINRLVSKARWGILQT